MAARRRRKAVDCLPGLHEWMAGRGEEAGCEEVTLSPWGTRDECCALCGPDVLNGVRNEVHDNPGCGSGLDRIPKFRHR